MINLEQAKKLVHGTRLYHIHNKNADGTPQRWRVNGKVKTWKRSPSRISVPLKWGLYGHGYLTEADLSNFCLTAKEVKEIQW